MRPTLPDEIRALLMDGKPRTATEIALEVRGRRGDVDACLARVAQRAPAPTGGNPRAWYWENKPESSRPVPRGNKGRAARMLAVLRDGREHSREEILRLAPGPFFLTNNAASDLRRRGYTVEHRVQDGTHIYRLTGSPLDGPDGSTTTSSPPSETPLVVRHALRSGPSSGTQDQPSSRNEEPAQVSRAGTGAAQLFELPGPGAYDDPLEAA